jgi:hypothetical protein
MTGRRFRQALLEPWRAHRAHCHREDGFTAQHLDTSDRGLPLGRSQLDVMSPWRHRYDDSRPSSDGTERLLIDKDFYTNPTVEETGSDEGQRGHSGRR